jgi:hypothetical protein
VCTDRRSRAAFWSLPVLVWIGWAAASGSPAPNPDTSADEPETRASSPVQGALPTAPSTRPLAFVPPERAPVGAGAPAAVPGAPSPRYEAGRVLDPALDGSFRPSRSFLQNTSTRTRGPPPWIG